MAGVKFLVIYPRPTDVEAFEKVYRDEHIPMAAEKRKTRHRDSRAACAVQPNSWQDFSGAFQGSGSRAGGPLE